MLATVTKIVPATTPEPRSFDEPIVSHLMQCIANMMREGNKPPPSEDEIRAYIGEVRLWAEEQSQSRRNILAVNVQKENAVVSHPLDPLVYTSCPVDLFIWVLHRMYDGHLVVSYVPGGIAYAPQFSFTHILERVAAHRKKNV